MKIFIAFLLAWSQIASAESALTENSFSSVTVGENVKSALKKLPGYVEAKLEPSDSCYYLSAPAKKPSASFMVLDGVVVRIEVHDKDQKIKTSKGVQIGSSKSEVLKKYSNVKVSPHHYTAPDGEYLEVKLDNGLGIIFETYKNVVTEFRLGSYPAIEFVEGCL